MKSMASVMKAKVHERCIVSTCSRGDCAVDLTNAPSPCVLIDIDRCVAVDPDLREIGGKRCDFVFVGDDGDGGWIVPMEFKGGANVQFAKAVQQLAAGARWTERKLAVDGNAVTVVPVVVIEKGVTPRRDQYRRLRLGAVDFQQGKWPVRLLRCGERLANLTRT